MSSEESEEDLHQCGRCKAVFNKITDYVCHKKSRVCQKSTTAGALHKSQLENNLFIRHVIEEIVASKPDTCDETQSSIFNSTPESPVAAFSPSGISDPGVTSAVKRDEAHRPDSGNTVLVAHESSSVLLLTDSLERSSVARSQCESVEASTQADVSSDASLQESRASDVIGADPVCTSEPCRPQPYQCPKCNFTAAHRDDFDQHLRREHCLSAHVCPRCKRPQANAHKLKWHKRRCKKNIENATDGEFSVGEYLPLQRRKKSVTAETVLQRSFQCKICSTASFDSYDSVLSHVSAEHSAIRPGICRFCGMWFENVYKLRRHVTSSVHDNDVSDADLQSFKVELEQITVRYTADAIRLLKQACQSRAQQQLVKQCELCRLTFCSRHALLRHQRVVHSQQRQQMTQATMIDAPTISCQHCGMSFDRRRAYLRHRRDTHCKLIVEPSSMTLSSSSASSDLKQCNVCGRTFKHSSHAKRHQRLLHSTRQQMPLAILRSSSFISVACNDVAVNSVKQSDEQCFVCFTFLTSQRDLVCHLELYHRVWVLRATVQSTELQHLSDSIIQNPVAFRFVEEQSAAFQQRPNGLLSKDSNVSKTTVDTRGGTCDVGNAAAVGVDCLRDSCVVLQSADAAVLPTTGSSSASLVTTQHHVCPYCSSSFSTLEEIYRHKVAEHHLEAVFRCVNATCLAQFRKLADYKLHVADSGHSQVAFICSVCNDHFADKPMLLWHRSSTHRHVKSSIVKSSKKLSHSVPSGKHKTSKKAASSSQLGFKAKQCSICKARFSSRGAVARHRVVAHAVGIHCTQCNCIFAKREHFQRHYMSRHSSSKPHACVEPGCGRSFKRKDKLLEHIRCHVSSSDNNVVPLSFACSKCDSRFRRRDSLRRHEKSHHLQQPALTPAAASRQSQHKCTRCPAKFSHLSKLLQHLHREHGRGAGKDVYAHQCSTCGKQFPRPERLKRHVERVHNISTNWLHRCSYCGKGFSGTRSYDAHVSRHHSNGESGSTVEHPRHHSKRADIIPPLPDEDNVSSPACGLSADTPTHQLYPVAVSANVTTSSLIPFDHNNHNNLIYSSNFGRLLASSVDPANIMVGDSVVGGLSTSQVYTSLSDSVVSAELSRRSCNEIQFTRAAAAASEHSLPNDAALSSRPGYYQSPPCSLPCLHHPGANLGSSAYSVYSSGYRSQPTSYRAPSQFGFYHTPQFGYSSYPSVAACSGLFSETNNSLLPPFGARSSWSQLESSQQTRWSAAAAAANADTRTSALDIAPAACSCQTSTTTTTTMTPVRSLVNHHQSRTTFGSADEIQQPPNRCFGRWFDGVPSLLSSAPSVDQANLDPASCWSRPPVLTPSLIDPTPYHCFGGTSAVSSSSEVAVKGLSNFGRTSALAVTTENSSMAFSYSYPSFKSYQYPSAVDGKIYSVGTLGLASRNYESQVSTSAAPSGAESSIFSRRSMGSLHYHQHQQQYAGASSSSSAVPPAVHVPLSLLPPPAPPPTAPQNHNRFRQQFANYQHWPPSMPMYNRF